MNNSELKWKVAEAVRMANANDPNTLTFANPLAQYIFDALYCQISPCNYPGLKEYNEKTDQEKLKYWKSREPIFKIDEDFKSLPVNDKLDLLWESVLQNNSDDILFLGNAVEAQLFSNKYISYDESTKYINLTPLQRIQFWKNKEFNQWDIETKLNWIPKALPTNIPINSTSNSILPLIVVGLIGFLMIKK